MYKIGITPSAHRSYITDPLWVKSFLQAAEAAGAESVWTGERPTFFKGDEAVTAGGIPDPLEWLSFAAAASSKIRLCTGVVLLPFHNPAVLAKRAATLDVLSGGRVELGLGVGWNPVEFQALGLNFKQRGAYADEGIAILRKLWAPGTADHQGRFWQFQGLGSDPKPAQAGGIPIVIGGSMPAGAARAGRFGDGYYPYALSAEDTAARIEIMRQAAQEAGRDPAKIELSAAPGSHKPCIDDVGAIRAFAQAGITRFVLRPSDFGGHAPDEIERGIKGFRDNILARL